MTNENENEGKHPDHPWDFSGIVSSNGESPRPSSSEGSDNDPEEVHEETSVVSRDGNGGGNGGNTPPSSGSGSWWPRIPSWAYLLLTLIVGLLLWWMNTDIIDVLLILSSVILLPVVLYVSALNDWQATLVREATVKVIVQGESFLKMLPNIPGKKVNSEGKLVDLAEGKSTYKGILGSGIYWVSILYPYRKVHRFKILKSNLLSEEKRRGKKITEWVTQEEALVSELRWRFPIPFLIENVDLRQGFRAHFVVYVLFEVVDPYTAIFIWHGLFAEQLATAIEGATNDFGKEHTYKKLLTLKLGKGNTVFTPKYLTPLNQKTEEGGEGIQEQFGIEILGGWIEGFDPSEEDKKLLEAVQEEERQRLLAEGVRREAEGRADAIRYVAQAEGERGQRFVGGMTDVGVNPETAARVFGFQVRGENSPRLTTIVEGGGGAIPAIPLNNPDPDKSDEPEPKKGGKNTTKGEASEDSKKE